MTSEIIDWESAEESLGRAVVAIGVFDGVHLGHQALIRNTVALADRYGARPVAITFDRDPDRVITPDSAAPQLLTLDEKLEFLSQAGAESIVVVPFSRKIAELSPRSFVTDVLLAACEPLAVVVGTDFRFGRSASGSVATMQALGSQRGFEVVPQALLEIEGGPVTSTRIRALVAVGDVAAAALLLGRPHRIHGPVVHGRGAGVGLGFPTANIMPDPYAALPAAGVYAGRVLVQGVPRPAAISVGRPPMFPDATDTLEAHIIGYEGDLYGLEVTVEFIGRIRDHERYDSVEELSVAIARDVEQASAIATEAVDGDDFELNPIVDVVDKVAGAMGVEDRNPDLLDDGTPVVENPEALEAAEHEVAAIDPMARYSDDQDWVQLLGHGKLSGLLANAGWTAVLVTAPLDARGIPYLWLPYAPGEMPGFRPAYGVFDTEFSLLVPRELLEEARGALTGDASE